MMVQEATDSRQIEANERNAAETTTLRHSELRRTELRPTEKALTATMLRAFGLVLTLLINALLARTLSPADFGRFALLTNLLLVLCCIGRFGLERTIVRFVASALTMGSREYYRATFTKGFTIALVTTTMVVAAWTILASWNSLWLVGFELSPRAIICMAVMIACGSLLMIASESFRVTQHSVLANLSMAETSSFVIASLNLAFVGYLCWAYGNSLDLSLSSLALAMLVPSIIALVFLKKAIIRSQPDGLKDLEANASRLQYRTLLAAGGIAMLIQTITNLTLTSDLWFVERFCQPEDLGRFAAAKRLVNLSAIPMSVISASAAAYIAIYFEQNNKLALQALVRKLVVLGAFPSIVFLVFCLTIPKLILENYYGVAYGEASQILMIFTFGYFCLAIVGAAEMCLVMTGRLRIALLISSVAFATLVVGSILLSVYGAVAIAWVSSCVLAARSLAMCIAFGVTSGTWTNLRFSIRT